MKLIPFIAPTLLESYGTHNGYVAVPIESYFYEYNYTEHYNDDDVDVHGGITYSDSAKNNNVLLSSAEFINGDVEVPKDYWIIGFDTCHGDDTPEKWNREKVIKETLYLMEQMKDRQREIVSMDDNIDTYLPKEEFVSIYNPKDKLIASTNDKILFDYIRFQIEEKQLSGYYLLFKGDKIRIDKNGTLECYPKGLFDKLFGIQLKLVGD